MTLYTYSAIESVGVEQLWQICLITFLGDWGPQVRIFCQQDVNAVDIENVKKPATRIQS